METTKCAVLMCVLECGSLSRAAEELGYTQSGVSRVLKSLEEEIGLELLRRNKGGVTPTENLRRLLPSIRSLLNDEERIRQTVSSLRGLNEGRLRIGAFTSVSVHWLPQIIKAYESVYPNIEITILGGDYHDVELWLAEGAIDIGFVTLPSDANCRFIPLKEDRLLAVLPSDHKYADLDRLPVTRIADEPFISLLESSDHDTRKALDAYGIKPNVKFTSKDDYAILAMVENGLGMTIMPELLLKGRRDRVKTMELIPGAKRTIALALPSVGATPAAENFSLYVLDFLKNGGN
ncbi:MAG: LysR family transcriptional regulator [Clostridia bacterium]|nr:LysR family transcriptional regulator [Clostridia bacterium]